MFPTNDPFNPLGDLEYYNKTGKKKKKHTNNRKKHSDRSDRSERSEHSDRSDRDRESKSPVTKVGTRDLRKSGEGKSKLMGSKKANRTQPPERVGPSLEAKLINQNRKPKFNTMPTELHNPSSDSQKISRTVSEDNLVKMLKRSLSQDQFGVSSSLVPEIAALHRIPNHQTPPLLSPSGFPLSAIVDVEWLKKTQKVELSGNFTLAKLKQTISTAFGLDLDFIGKVALVVVLEYFFNNKYEPITENSVANIHHGMRLRMVVVDSYSDYGE
jgi:hypothetical protein